MKRVFFNKAIRTILFTDSLVMMAAAILGPIYALFVEKIGGDLMDASLTGGIFALVTGIVTLISGKYSDKVKENELIMVFGYLIMGVGFLLYIIVNSIWFLFLVQVLIGFGRAIYTPVCDAIFSKHLTQHKPGFAWATWESLNYFTLAGGAIMGGLIITYFAFNAAFIIMAALCFWAAVYIYFLPRKEL